MYKKVFEICLKHEYFTENICAGIQLNVSALTLILIKRRGLIFRQSGANKWCFVADCTGGGVDELSDIFTLEMRSTDPAFMYYTDWEGHNPAKTCLLELPCDSSDIDIVPEMNKNQIKRVGSVICLINLRLSNRMFDLAKEGHEMKQVLVFHNSKKYWEYLFVPRSEIGDKKIKIEETKGLINFEEITQIQLEIFDFLVYRTISTTPIPIKECYDYQISLKEVVREAPLMVRTIIRDLTLPRMGLFRSEDPNVIQHISYF